ncbi:hypothetical protein [Streptomyces cylindrosporus]|uniref:Uncharacterized protein n=1 Tax=Streptomyces cylindrosporus TaxID=2927583 RepID=A0ABS9YAF8_9ACTN|nr:hypothetical protein [Streptomyces cylindrosporus]MCI3274206.1 hypothetical protein [Streptomyces cylindrosporus]
MADRRDTGADGEPVPRDLPDQQVQDGEDPLDIPVPEGEGGEVPEPDEAGTGREGGPRSANVHPEHPDPDESSA